MSDFSLQNLLEAAGNRMRSDLAERLVAHPGERGIGREQVIREFLRSYLPKRFDVTGGFSFDSSGVASKQLDVIVANSFVCPRFETAGGIRFYPCESVVAVGQVKSSLTSRAEFQDALENLKSVKSLDRSVAGTAFDTTYGECLNHLENHLHQVFTFLVVTGRALSPITLRGELAKYLEQHEPHLWPNVILALDQCLITYACDDGVCPNAMHARGLALQESSTNPDILMRFYLLLGRAVQVTRVSGLGFGEYLDTANSWEAEVLYPASEDPPPFLHRVSGLSDLY